MNVISSSPQSPSAPKVEDFTPDYVEYCHYRAYERLPPVYVNLDWPDDDDFGTQYRFEELAANETSAVYKHPITHKIYLHVFLGGKMPEWTEKK